MIQRGILPRSEITGFYAEGIHLEVDPRDLEQPVAAIRLDLRPIPDQREGEAPLRVFIDCALRCGLLRCPLEFSTGRAATRRPPPMPGEQSDEILHELGLADAEILRLRAQGTI